MWKETSVKKVFFILLKSSENFYLWIVSVFYLVSVSVGNFLILIFLFVSGGSWGQPCSTLWYWICILVSWLSFHFQVDILPRLLLPLAGPTPDSLDDDDIDKLPIDLQYLDETKKVEDDADIRKLLLEALLQVNSAQTWSSQWCRWSFWLYYLSQLALLRYLLSTPFMLQEPRDLDTEHNCIKNYFHWGWG